jgi:hypothetical protein
MEQNPDPSPNTSEAETDFCTEETWSWWHFSDQQMDPYWIRCTLVGPHEEHEDENTGLKWYSDPVDLGPSPRGGTHKQTQHNGL